jgi:hypothetical protein
LRHSLNHFELPTKLVVLLGRSLRDQDGLREIPWIDHDDLRPQRDCHESDGEQDEQ